MAKIIRLVDLIENEISKMGYHEKKRFKIELQETLPGYIRQAARAVKAGKDKLDPETLSVKQE